MLTIRLVGWSGIVLNAIAIGTRNTYLFLIGQIVATTSAFLWARWIQKSITWDLVLSLALTTIAAICREPFIMYAAMLVRSISYQLVFERMVRERRDNDDRLREYRSDCKDRNRIERD